jgi:putative IMPACT (imprinted ancient) family translation regulator
MPASTTLDSFILSSRPQPKPLAISQEITDRGSIFIANLYHISSPTEARSGINHLKHIIHRDNPASHEIAAWRCMVLKKGRTGLGGPDDFELSAGSVDDGERWAGEKVLKTMEMHAVIDAVVVVSRWWVLIQ